mmetsp:Transcript_29209/g.33441  ORF Transcript_29209/g.33441 Transcript_29209/m.33441 type:complete len:147 (+) Transcript_29209:1420-1860(+)
MLRQLLKAPVHSNDFTKAANEIVKNVSLLSVSWVREKCRDLLKSCRVRKIQYNSTTGVSPLKSDKIKEKHIKKIIAISKPKIAEKPNVHSEPDNSRMTPQKVVSNQLNSQLSSKRNIKSTYNHILNHRKIYPDVLSKDIKSLTINL